MFEIFTHEYFLLSFLPIAILSGGFWLLFFDRADNKNEPLILLGLALTAGILSAITFLTIGEYLKLENFYVKIIGEELSKIVFAILIMEIFKQRFQTISAGIIYGFAIGLGFAITEDISYLVTTFETTGGFQSEFWLTFQGRFWSTTLLHGVTTATFGLFYAGAYLSHTIYKNKKESPLRVFFVPPNIKQLFRILTLHVSRKHLLFGKEKTLTGHLARAVIMEGFLVAVLIHTAFNLAIKYSHPQISFFIAIFGLYFLGQKSKINESL
ncbi:MAG: PrsW family glutamic-type intramembrane protease [Candidatus Peregrinibacteria bacterium]|nr:PrsW family glutamic-type intramembrane protease [Candidatus Peregrinibacteria bacterium]